ncbi:MAG: protein kinase [Myxococcota bacterium]
MSQPERHAETGRDEDNAPASGSPAHEAATQDGAGAANADVARPPTLPQIGDVVAGRYEVLRSLGAGAMGHVFLASHTSLKKEVALKVLAPRASDEPEQAERFLREAQAASGLRHPRIVEITDFGSTEGGLPFFAMEYLAGEDLATSLDRSPRLAWPRVRALMLEILDGLACAHDHGVVHRDLKPENIFLASDTDHGQNTSVKLVDFGIAKLLTEPDAGRLTSDGRILGTPQYMSPEQAVGKRVDARSDIYAAGILMFEMLTGSLPFFEGSTMAILSQQITQPPPSLRDAAPDLVLDELPALELVVARALEKNPDQRYATAADMAEAIRGVGRHAAAPSTGARWPLLVGAAVVLALVAIAWLRQDTTAPAAPPSATERTAAEQTTAERTTVERTTVERTTVEPPSQAAVAPAANPSATIPADNPGPVDVATADQDEVTPVHDDPTGATTGDGATAATGREAPPAKKPKNHGPTHRKPQTHAAPPAPEPPALPDQASDDDVTVALQRAAQRCSAFVSRGGQRLGVDVSIAADGNVSGAVVQPPYNGDHPLGRCIAKAVNASQVPAAARGRSFRGTIRLVHAPKP